MDQVDFELPYGILGKLFEAYTYNQLRKIFDHRKIATIKKPGNLLCPETQQL